ncbi:MAG: 4-alpha-glucanotransferase [Pseudomonadota bacterium]
MHERTVDDLTGRQEPMLSLTAARKAGVCMHITSLPGPHGIGEIGRDAHAFVEAISAAGLEVWQLLPTGPTAYGDSPYQPLSSRAGNPMLIELRDLVELGLLHAEEIDTLRSLSADKVEYGSLIDEKTRLLQRAALRFEDVATTPLLNQYAAFVGQHDKDWLHDYALFRTLKTMHAERPWIEWQPEFRDRHSQALQRLATEQVEAIFAVKLIQFLFYRQWERLREVASENNVLLFGDMPIYLALDCADAWARRELLRLDEQGQPTHVAGVPPDYFSEDGQLWGNPLYDWEYHASTGFDWWVGRVQHTLTMVDIVRIDHFRGFETYWSIPWGSENARTGVWEYGPKDALFEAITARLGPLPIVAEDLGDITPEVTELRQRQSLPGMSVLQFMVPDVHFDPDQISRDSVAYTGTHDNDTSVGWFLGGPGDMRSANEIREHQALTLERTGGTAADVHWGLVRMAFGTEACMAIIPMQDFLGLGSDARLNTPGKPADNWQWRLRAGQFDSQMITRIREAVIEADRLSQT